jgi:hypothetical protein
MGPDFLYIGCQKAGSRWLYDQLSAHADFWMPPIKELHYFDGYEWGRAVRGGLAYRAQQTRPTPARRKGLLSGLLRGSDRQARQTAEASFMEQVWAGDGGKLDLDWYASLFRWKGGRLSGDVTPDYATLSPRTISLIAARFPDLRCILFVRDPVARAWSHACMVQRRTGSAAPMSWPEMESFLTKQKMAALSSPSQTLARWRDHVPAERIFVGFFDQLSAEPEILRADVLRFLGASSSPPPIEPGFDRKRDQGRSPCPPEIQWRLADWFADELDACARAFGGPATTWLSRYGLVSTNV